MRTRITFALIGLLVILFAVSCVDIFERDIQYDKVELFAPGDSLITTNKTNKFWWSTITGALWYELQVVSPDFSQVSSIALDTLLEKSNFQFTLQPGVYHWRVRAINCSSSTEYTENALVITNE